DVLVGLATRDQIAAAASIVFGFDLFEQYPGQSASLMGEFLGASQVRGRMPSGIRISFSQGRGFISSKPLRTTTVTSSPPRRREERQQSIAVLPPPSTTTRRPILSMWPNETLESQSMPM